MVHGHITIHDRIVNIPGYLVKYDEEPEVSIRKNSSYKPPSLVTTKPTESPVEEVEEKPTLVK